ncbi:MAG: hypothetical protein ABIO96_10055 [Nitrospiraceae bacterium]
MAILRMPLWGLSLYIVMLLWPPSSLAGPEKALSAYAEMCTDDMGKLYKQVEALESLDNLNNEAKKASVSGKAQEFINKSLPKFKERCPTEANSIKDLENGHYFQKMAAAREKRKKARGDIKATGDNPDSESFEDLSLQQ